VINRGNNKQTTFIEEEDFRQFLNTIQRYKKKYGFQLFAYCLMTNHIHLLIKVSKKGSISQIMQSITVAQTRYFNHKYHRCGHVWQGRFLSPIVSEDRHLLNVMRYIEQNPLRAGMVKRLEDYRWSSHLLNIRKAESILIDRHLNKVFQQMGENLFERIMKYKQFIKRNLTDRQIEAIHKSTRKGVDYISERFKKKITELLPKRRKNSGTRKFLTK